MAVAWDSDMFISSRFCETEGMARIALRDEADYCDVLLDWVEYSPEDQDNV
jgi:hypothetical protein